MCVRLRSMHKHTPPVSYPRLGGNLSSVPTIGLAFATPALFSWMMTPYVTVNDHESFGHKDDGVHYRIFCSTLVAVHVIKSQGDSREILETAAPTIRTHLQLFEKMALPRGLEPLSTP